MVGNNILFKVRLLDFSASGCKIGFEKQDKQIPNELKIKFGFEKAPPFLLEVEIKWSREEKGKSYMGMKFKNIDDIEKERIRKYLRDLKSGDRYTM